MSEFHWVHNDIPRRTHLPEEHTLEYDLRRWRDQGKTDWLPVGILEDPDGQRFLTGFRWTEEYMVISELSYPMIDPGTITFSSRYWNGLDRLLKRRKKEGWKWAESIPEIDALLDEWMLGEMEFDELAANEHPRQIEWREMLWRARLITDLTHGRIDLETEPPIEDIQRGPRRRPD